MMVDYYDYNLCLVFKVFKRTVKLKDCAVFARCPNVLINELNYNLNLIFTSHKNTPAQSFKTVDYYFLNFNVF